MAIGIVGRPEVLFLDEPTTGLDPEARRRAWTAVENLTTTGTTVVLTTHYIDEADHLANRLILLAGGKIIADTTPDGLRAQGGPATIRYHLPDDAPLDDLPATLTAYVDPASHDVGRPDRRPDQATAGPARLGRPLPPRPLPPRGRTPQPRRRLPGSHRPTHNRRVPSMTDTSHPAQPRMPSIGRLLDRPDRLSGPPVGQRPSHHHRHRVPDHPAHRLAPEPRPDHRSLTSPASPSSASSLTAWNTYGVRLVAARESGVLKRWWATPLPRWCYFLGRILATVAVATVAGAATVAAGVLLYNTHLTVSGALGTLVVFVFGAFAWAATATALTAAVSTLEAAAPDVPGDLLPNHYHLRNLRRHQRAPLALHLASYLPAQPLAQAAGAALGHTSGHAWLPARDLAVLAAWAIGGMAIAVVTFRWEPHRPTQRRPARPLRQTRPIAPGAANSGIEAARPRQPRLCHSGRSQAAVHDSWSGSEPVVRLLAGHWASAVLGKLATEATARKTSTPRSVASLTSCSPTLSGGPSATALSAAISTTTVLRPTSSTNSPTSRAHSRTPFRSSPVGQGRARRTWRAPDGAGKSERSKQAEHPTRIVRYLSSPFGVFERLRESGLPLKCRPALSYPWITQSRLAEPTGIQPGHPSNASGGGEHVIFLYRKLVEFFRRRKQQ